MAEERIDITDDYSAAMRQVATHFEQVRDKLAEVVGSVNSIQLNGAIVDTRLATMDARLGTLDMRINRIDERLNGLDVGMSELNTKIDVVIGLLTKKGE